MKIGFVGLGALGSMLARQFLGHDLTVWDINPAAVQALVADGARSAATAAELARRCDVVFTCLPRSRDVHALMFTQNGLSEGLSAGKLVIDQTSGIPSETIAIAGKLKEMGVDMIDAAVSASPQIVSQGGATLMVGGPEAMMQRAMPFLKIITQTIQHCGIRVGDGQAMKMVNNAINGTNRVGMFEIVSLGRRLGIPLESMRDVFGASAAQNLPAVRMLPAIVEGRASTNFGLPLMLKDINQAVSLGSDSGSPMPVTSAARALHQFGVNYFGPKSNLEDTIKLAEILSDTTFRTLAETDVWDPNSPTGAVPSVCIVADPLCGDLCKTLTRRLSAKLVKPENLKTPAGQTALATADILLLALGGPDQALTVLADVVDGLSGKTVLWMSGGIPDVISDARAQAEKNHAAFVDAVFCNVPTIAADSVLAWSGDRQFSAKLAPVFAAISMRSVYCGTEGKSADLATLNTALATICAVVTLECAMVGERAGLSMERMAAVLGLGSSSSAALRSILPRLASGNPDKSPVLVSIAAELKRFNQLAIDAGTPAFIAQAARAVVEAGIVNLGHAAGLDDLATYFSGAH